MQMCQGVADFPHTILIERRVIADQHKVTLTDCHHHMTHLYPNGSGLFQVDYSHHSSQ